MSLVRGDKRALCLERSARVARSLFENASVRPARFRLIGEGSLIIASSRALSAHPSLRRLRLLKHRRPLIERSLAASARIDRSTVPPRPLRPNVRPAQNRHILTRAIRMTPAFPANAARSGEASGGNCSVRAPPCHVCAFAIAARTSGCTRFDGSARVRPRASPVAKRRLPRLQEVTRRRAPPRRQRARLPPNDDMRRRTRKIAVHKVSDVPIQFDKPAGRCSRRLLNTCARFRQARLDDLPMSNWIGTSETLWTAILPGAASHIVVWRKTGRVVFEVAPGRRVTS